MYPRQELDASIRSHTVLQLRSKFFSDIIHGKFRAVLQKPSDIPFIFLRADRTGAVYESSARLHIRPGTAQDLPLKFHQAFDAFRRSLVFQIRFLPEHTQPGTGQVCNHNIRLSGRHLIRNRGVPADCRNIRKTGALDVFPDQSHL